MENENATMSKSSGALIGTVIVLVIIVLGGVYLWSTKVQPKIEQKLIPPTEEQVIVNETATTDTAVEQLNTQSPSDETASIESDLAATNLDSIDKNLQAI